MIFTSDGTPLNIALGHGAVSLAERLRVRGPYGREFRRPAYVQGVDGTRSWYVDKDKLGRLFKVYRAVHVHRPGKGYTARQAYKAWLDEPKTYPGPVQPPVAA